VTGVDTAQRYLPGSRDLGVGGDWFDVITLSCGRVALVIGDVMGRGLRAAAAMGQLRTAVRMLAVLDPMPEDLLRHLDVLAQDTDEVQLATCVYAVFDPVTRSLSYATAGHPPPVLQRPDGATELLPQPSGAPLGVGGVPFESVTLEVPDGARLVLYTDGLIESRDVDIDDGLRRLGRALEDGPPGLDPLCDHVLAALDRAAGHEDDVALLVTQLTGLGPDRVRTWQLDGGLESVAAARAWVRSTLDTWGLESMVELAELLVSELVTNALRHANGPIELTALLLDDVVTLGISDADQPLPRLRKARRRTRAGAGCSSSRCSRRAGAPGRRPRARSSGASCPARARRLPGSPPATDRAFSPCLQQPETTCATSPSSLTSTTARPPSWTPCSGSPARSRPTRRRRGRSTSA
jgi:hypothetical protein